MFALIQDLHDQFRQFELGLIPETVLTGALNRIQVLDHNWHIVPNYYPVTKLNWAPTLLLWFQEHWDGGRLT